MTFTHFLGGATVQTRTKQVGRSFRLVVFPAALILTVACFPAQKAAGLEIDPVFDSTVTSLPNAAQVESAFNYAASQIEALFRTRSH